MSVSIVSDPQVFSRTGVLLEYKYKYQVLYFCTAYDTVNDDIAICFRGVTGGRGDAIG